MHKPICVKCHRFFKVKKSGYYFIEGMPKENNAPSGLEAPDRWQPYKLWAGDLMECKGCGTQIIYGFGMAPISEHYKDGFKEAVERLGADQFQVNDC